MASHYDLLRKIHSAKNKKNFHWLMKNRLIKRHMKCPSCRREMKLQYRQKQEPDWVCRDKCHNRKTIRRSIRKGSIFEKSHVKLQTWIHYICRFAQGLRLRQIDMLQEGITRSSTTLSKLASKLRKVCKSAMKRMRRDKRQRVGSPREVVMIDESKFGHKRKYNKGRSSNRNSWVFGMLGVRNQGRRPVLRVVKNRSTRHLMPILKKYVKHGSTVISDGWRAYSCLENEGYLHLIVNHEESFVHPMTGAHTQNFERMWGVCKSSVWRLRGNRSEISLKEHLDLIEWTYWRGNRHSGGPLGMLLHDIRKQYTV